MADDEPINDALQLIGMLCEADVPHEYEATPTQDEDSPDYDEDTDDVHAVIITGVARFEFEGNALKAVKREHG